MRFYNREKEEMEIQKKKLIIREEELDGGF